MRTTAASYLALAAMSSFAVATDWCGKWTLLSTSAPGSRLDAKIAFDAARGEVILYGGIVKSGNADVYMGDTWSWNGATWTLRATSGPGGRAFHGMVYDEARQEIVVHGGWTSGLATSTWTWNGVSWTEHAVPGPGERGYLPLAYDTDRQRVVLFGGTAKTHAQVFSDTWEWDGTSWTQVDIGSDVPARAGHTTVYHQKQGRVIVFGGGSSGSTFADGRSWDGAAWTSLPSSGSPSPRGTATSGYLPTVGASVMFGGWFPNAFVSDTTWIWDGSTWSQLTAPGPAPSAYDTMTYDPIGKRLLLLRGSELWGLQLSRSQPAFASQPLALTRYPVEEAVFAIGELPGGTTVQWTRNGLPLGASSRLSGFNSPTLRISPIQASDAGVYRAVLTNLCNTSTTSKGATLTVKCPADLNGDRFVDDADFLVFLPAYDAFTTDRGDFNFDTLTDDLDFSLFAAAYDELICP